jgi:ABC-type transport system involved in multi-copper enzyme maturation permease subunit
MSPPKASSWSLWRAQVGAILRLEVKKNFLARRGLWIYLVALAPAALWWVHASLNLRDGRRCELGRDSLLFATMFQFFYLRLAIFFGCVGVFMKLFRGEMLEKSLHYYLLAPVRREVLLAGKYLAGVITTSIVFSTGTVLALAGLLGHFPRSVIEQYLFGAGGLGHVLAYVGVAALACVGYGGVFLLMSFLFRNPIIPTVLVLLWESMNPFLPSMLKKLSVIFYLQSLCPLPVPAQGDFAFLAVLTEPTPAYLAVPGLLLVTAAGLLIAARQVRKLEINYGGD